VSALPRLRDTDPFDLANDAAYRRWRDAKLARHPRRIEDLLVEVHDPRSLTDSEYGALLDRVQRDNMVIYASGAGSAPDKEIPRQLGRRFGLDRLDCNLLADDDGITPLAVVDSGERTAFIPYTNRPIRWHTDGYYNTPERQIRGMVLHCVTPAAQGGENRLLDHEIAYIELRDRDLKLVRALMQPDAMTIPARTDEDGVARAEQSGPVFSVDGLTGALHMRYTARTHSIAWKQDAPTLAAVEALKALLASDSPFIFRGRLESGMGLLCNNVLHDRAGFSDAPGQSRLLYRARYYDRIAGT
jgi:Taurine catabolism dioxygenase TauD, TfdA family